MYDTFHNFCIIIPILNELTEARDNAFGSFLYYIIGYTVPGDACRQTYIV
jgi:hypothetical protein